ncbi:ABC transporter ATP-binding protein [Cereibacter changlensis]|uniref:ABC transporter ATP-binding protein n=1 Tax=Cereibacter changlensis TaxID=402884 RepID=UPI004033A2BC
MAGITLHSLRLSFGQTRAVDGVDLQVPPGAFFALLGPSGCGKTSLLRLIAGLERPGSGSISIGAREVAGPGRFVEPGARGLGMVFQSYALWPHMTVAQNVAFGLNRLSAADRAARITEALQTVGLDGAAARRPHELSGGQRQRVALARSLASRPSLILLDEPLANLDAHLRQSMLAEFRRIHQSLGTTFVFVTHDQNEAMAIAGLVGVMDRGRMAQVAPPQELFDRPATPMVARFVGEGRTLPVTVTALAQGRATLRLGDHSVTLPGIAQPGPAWLCLRQRDLALSTTSAGLGAQVIDLRFERGDYILSVLPDAPDLTEPLEVRSPTPAAPGARVRLTLRSGWVMPRAGGAAETAPDCEPARPLERAQG